MCDCIKTIDEKLAAEGQFLNCTMAFRTGEVSRPMIDIIRKDTWKPERRRGKPGFFVANNCPFCGEEYAQRPAAEGVAIKPASDGEDGKGGGADCQRPNTNGDPS